MQRNYSLWSRESHRESVTWGTVREGDCLPLRVSTSAPKNETYQQLSQHSGSGWFPGVCFDCCLLLHALLSCILSLPLPAAPLSLPQPLSLQEFAEMSARGLHCRSGMNMAEAAWVIIHLAGLWVSAPSTPPPWNMGSCSTIAASPGPCCVEKSGSHGEHLHLRDTWPLLG